MPPTRVLTLTLATTLAALTLTACGRRGALEPPDTGVKPQRSVAQAAPTKAGARQLPQSTGLGEGAPEPDPLAVQAGDELSLSAIPPSGTEAPVETSRGAKRGYRIPKDPFLLDPLL